MANHPYANPSKLLHESNVYVGNNFIDMYNKCGSIVDTWKMFNMVKCHCFKFHDTRTYEMWAREEGVIIV
jgi:hypothetical protein